MELEPGQLVLSSDGQNIDTIKPLVLDPANDNLFPSASNGGFPLFVPIVDGQLAIHPLTEEEERLRKRDESNAVISAGDEVISLDREKVGEVQSVFFDSATGRPTRLIVRHGWLFHQDWELSADVIAAVDEGVVYLRQDKARLHYRREEELYTTEWGQVHKPN